jgi:putative inorganic carbon (HCO3(-)) transporter
MITPPVLAFAALTGPLPKAGVIAATLLVAMVLLVADRRARAAAMLIALVLCTVLLLADLWNSPRLAVVHRHPLVAAVGAIVLIALLIGAGLLVVRRPAVIAPLAVAALPFRVPIQAGGTTANLLVPLYAVVGVGTLAWILSVVRPPRRAPASASPPGWTPTGGTRSEAGPRTWRGADLVLWSLRLLALYIVLYGVQAAYSPDFIKALQNVVFFYVPFALLLCLLRDLEWDRPTLGLCLRVTVVLALIFSLIGFYEYATRTLLLNSKLIAANDIHTYFTVNSVFLDPDIFGRYLALVMVLLAVGLIYRRARRDQLTTVAVLAVLWACLVLTLSRSSLAALLVGMAVLAALRWRPSRAIIVAAVIVVLGAGAIAVSPTTFGLNQGINGATSGRGGLVSGGLSLFGDRPIQGYGSGSFSEEYGTHHRHTASTLTASHTIPVTVAAEQGLIGELAYVAFVLVAFAALLRGARGDPVRSAIAAAFIALVFDTLLYADFLEDPTTWVLLGTGVVLARARPMARVQPSAGQEGTAYRAVV